ncbi:zinc finger protein 541-like [Pristis pectinata]|uniref:zinc finger protein 541-like n=1 Tax=Pristis pectinata TaxID=685728 RepID=UPI00223D38C9|nr:zinc finger protein 541-like [Pristis pectinata]
MDCYSFTDESSLQTDMHLPLLSDSELPIASNIQRQEFIPDPDEIIYAGMTNIELDSNLEAAEIPGDPFADNLDLSLYTECSQCGKSFSSASALSKHYLTHSHERRHVCRICSKAFKRQDHLSGHLLTHQKNKPYVCMEHGCDKSYCDSRSLRRHYEVQHGLYCQREPFPDNNSKDLDSTESMLFPQVGHTQALQCDVAMAQRPTPQMESLPQRSSLPNRELLRPLMSNICQKVPGKSSKNVSVSRKERQKLDTSCTAPPSQVAMNSFSVQNSLRSMEDYLQKEHFHESVQGEDIYSLCSIPQEEDGHSSVLCKDLLSGNTTGNLEENGEKFRCERCQGVFHFLKGLNCHSCPREGMGKQHSLEDGVKPQKKPLEEHVATPLVIPVSVPVKAVGLAKDRKAEDSPVTPKKLAATRLTSNDSPVQVLETGKPVSVNCRGPSKKQRRKRCRPEPLFIPSPSSSQTGVPPGMVLYQSHMRSPVCLADHLLENFQPPSYTPPPMLSPIRHGSGLYFNRICSQPGSRAPYSAYIPKGIPGSVVDGVNGICGLSVVKDDSIITIQPHINIGTRFQAEIPLLQDKSLVEDSVHQADLVWKPWDDIETNKVTQARVTDLLNLACSSVLPGGGTNLELALHCLHDTRGDILAALDILLMKGARQDAAHPPGDYHYTGTENWTTAEKKMFNKAICLYNKDFFLMQKMIKHKTVAQCVEYYYTWKKQLKFEWKRTHLLEEEIKHEADSARDGKEFKKLLFLASQNMSVPSQSSANRENLKKKVVRAKSSASPSIHCQAGVQDKSEKKLSMANFPCKECTKVFAKVKSRNAHMKCHRQQEEQERQAEMKRSRIRFKVEIKEEPEETVVVFNPNNLQNITTP